MTNLVFIDADNTLWDTNAVYQGAQEWLLAAVEAETGAGAGAEDRLAYVRAVDQEIAARHHNGLRYPARLLASALALVLTGDSVGQAVKRVWADPSQGLKAEAAEHFEAEFARRLAALPNLRPGAAQAVEALSKAGFIVFVLTEGSRPRITATLSAHKLDKWVSKVLEAKKEADLFKRTRKLEGAVDAFMIGDQLDRDIAPAKAAGFTTIYFPGGFTPRWTPHELEVGPDYKVATLDEAAKIVMSASRASVA